MATNAKQPLAVLNVDVVRRLWRHLLDHVLQRHQFARRHAVVAIDQPLLHALGLQPQQSQVVEPCAVVSQAGRGRKAARLSEREMETRPLRLR